MPQCFLNEILERNNLVGLGLFLDLQYLNA